MVWLALALGAGTSAGIGFERAWPACAAAVLLAAGAAWLARRGAGPAWVPWVVLLACARASAVERPPACARPLTAVEASTLRAAPIAGRWRARSDGRTGWIAPFRDAPREPGHALLFEPECASPASGTPVAVLPGSEVVPWPAGPVAPQHSGRRRFAALAPVAPDELVRLGPASPAPWTPLAGWIAQRLADLRAVLGARAASLERASSAGLLRALATGARDGLPPERVDLFARTGTSHLLAISGWHVGLFAALVVLPLARASPTSRQSALALLARVLLLVVFAAVAGAEKPVLRATLALFLLQLAWLKRSDPRAPPRRPDGLSFLAAAFALECLYDPGGIGTLSLTLSYAATLGLILGTGALARALGPRRDPWAALAPWASARTLGARLGRWLASGLAGSAAAVLATLPLVWSTFGELAPAGAVLTLLALPPFTFLSVLAWLGALLPVSVLAAPAELGTRVLYAVLEIGDALPGTPLLLPPRPLWLLALATVLAFAGLRSVAARRAAALAWGVLLLPWSAAPRGLELHALDVGHGSALVLRGPGLEALVFDAGSRDRRAVASEALLPLLARWEVGRATVVLSHPDQDHAAGLARLSERVADLVWLGAEPAQAIVRRAHGFERADLRVDLLQGHLQHETRCPELALALLRGSPRAGNEGSRALEVAWRGERVLLLGDAEEAGLARLPLAPGPLRLLLAPHHGADAAALGALLDRCRPREVWISASGPPPIARELDRRRIPWRWTGRDGPLALGLR